jgi:hypothetical protein
VIRRRIAHSIPLLSRLHADLRWLFSVSADAFFPLVAPFLMMGGPRLSAAAGHSTHEKHLKQWFRVVAN